MSAASTAFRFLVFLLLGAFAGGGVVLSQERDEKGANPPARVEEGPPAWLKEFPFDAEQFTFVRLRYEGGRAGDRRAQQWATDYPDADLNLSARIAGLTSLRVNPQASVLDITDPLLKEHPFAYLSVNGFFELSESQVAALRAYLEGGGFLMVDDSWGDEERQNTAAQLAKLWPQRELQELPLEHPVFHGVYDLQEKPQVPSIHVAITGREGGTLSKLLDSSPVSYQGIADDSGRLMVLLCHNTDLADGWERGEVHPWYASEFSEKRAFPMGVNAVFYALTH